MVGAWVAVLVAEVIGAAVFSLLVSDLSRWTTAGKLGISYGLGWITLTVTLFVASLCGVIASPWLGIAEAAVLWSAAARFRRGRLSGWMPRRQRPEPPVPRWRRVVDVTLIGFISGVCVLVGAVSLLEPVVEWDVLASWTLKAKVLFHEPILATHYFNDLTKAYSHLGYPLLWPFSMVWVWSFVGRPDLEAAKVLAPGLLGGTALALYGLLRRRFERTYALVFVALGMGLPMLLSQTARLMADPPLAYFTMGSFVCAYLWLCSGHPDDLSLSGYLAAGLLFTKNEGMGLYLVLVVLAGGTLLLQKRYDRALPFLLRLSVLPLVLAGAWLVFRTRVSLLEESYAHRIAPGQFLHNLARVPEIVRGSARYFFDGEDWLAFWPVFWLAVVLRVRIWLRPPLLFLSGAVIVVFAMYGYIYVVNPWELAALMDSTANRLLLHVAPTCVFLLAELMAPPAARR